MFTAGGGEDWGECSGQIASRILTRETYVGFTVRLLYTRGKRLPIDIYTHQDIFRPSLPGYRRAAQHSRKVRKSRHGAQTVAISLLFIYSGSSVIRWQIILISGHSGQFWAKYSPVFLTLIIITNWFPFISEKTFPDFIHVDRQANMTKLAK